jgi:putative transposase
MPIPHAAPIALTESQQTILEQILRKQTLPHRLVQRARIILLASQWLSNTLISQQVNLHRHQVRYWRQRWQTAAEQIQELELEGISQKQLYEEVAATLSDQPRSGAPATFKIEQIVAIVAVACEIPDSSGRPISHWTPKELADEVIKRGIVSSISPRRVRRFLKRSQFTAPS